MRPHLLTPGERWYATGVDLHPRRPTSRPTAYAFALGACAALTSYACKSDPGHERTVLGRWQVDHTEESEGTTVSIEGTSEYFANKASNFEGEVTAVTQVEGKKMTLVYVMEGTSEWQIVGDEMLEKMVDVVGSIKSLGYDGVTVDGDKIPAEDLAQIPKLSDLMPKGKTIASKILSITPSEMRMETTTDGKKELWVYRRAGS